MEGGGDSLDSRECARAVVRAGLTACGVKDDMSVVVIDIEVRRDAAATTAEAPSEL